MVDAIGWIATAIFLASYACRDPSKLRLTQAGAALLWVAYGIVLHAIPIVVANLLVAGVAVYSSVSGMLERKQTAARAPGRELKPANEPDLSRIS
jgi:Bacterial inner membrane protein